MNLKQFAIDNAREEFRSPAAWVPSTHHQVPQPAGHECAAWYEYAQPSACEILYALAHVKGEADRLREELEKARAQALADRAFQSENLRLREINVELLAALRQIALEDPTREYAATIACAVLSKAKEGA